MRENNQLTNRQLLAINQILIASTLEEARQKAKISKGTLYTWLKDEAFKQELKRQRDEVVKEAIDNLKMAMNKAVKGLIELMDTKKPDLRRWIFKDIIDYSLKSIELEDLGQRLDKVEKSLLEKGLK